MMPDKACSEESTSSPRLSLLLSVPRDEPSSSVSHLMLVVELDITDCQAKASVDPRSLRMVSR